MEADDLLGDFVGGFSGEGFDGSFDFDLFDGSGANLGSGSYDAGSASSSIDADANPAIAEVVVTAQPVGGGETSGLRLISIDGETPHMSDLIEGINTIFEGLADVHMVAVQVQYNKMAKLYHIVAQGFDPSGKSFVTFDDPNNTTFLKWPTIYDTNPEGFTVEVQTQNGQRVYNIGGSAWLPMGDGSSMSGVLVPSSYTPGLGGYNPSGTTTSDIATPIAQRVATISANIVFNGRGGVGGGGGGGDLN